LCYTDSVQNKRLKDGDTYGDKWKDKIIRFAW